MKFRHNPFADDFDRLGGIFIQSESEFGHATGFKLFQDFNLLIDIAHVAGQSDIVNQFIHQIIGYAGDGRDILEIGFCKQSLF